MANLLVGDKECSYATVLKVIQYSPVKAIVLQGWRELARALDTQPEIVLQCEDELNLGKKGRLDVIKQLLDEWRSRKAKTATLGALMKLIQECHWNELAESIRKIIQTNAVQWNDLDEKSQQEVLNTPIEILGQKTTLNRIGVVLGNDRMNTALQLLRGDLLTKALLETRWNFDGSKGVNQITYYVQRTLTLQRQLHPGIFKEKCDDIFVVQGMERSELSSLAKPNRTSLSGNQVDEINVRFILLECDHDFELLCDNSLVPIHRIRYDSGNLFWISTVEYMGVIRKYLMDNIEIITEDDMIKQKLSSHNSRPIAIADCPGMGKTELLFQLARITTKHYPERYILTNISLQKLISSMAEQTGQLSLEVVIRSLAKCSSDSPLGQEILFGLMNCKSAKFEIFLDSFDEISYSQIQTAEQMLKVLSKSINLRALITTRLYMRDNLEQSVGVISWNIQPFTKNDQASFFLRYWTNQLQPRDTTRLQKFTFEFVEYLQSSELLCGKNDENDFAGIPLKCFMLAELYSDDAKRYVTRYSTKSGISPKLSKLNEMYRDFMESRFKKVPSALKPMVRKAHWAAAVQLLFPDWVDELKEFLEAPEFPSNDAGYRNILLTVGILQNVNPPSFTHRTFAEHLVADFVVSNLFTKCTENSTKKLIQFLFDAVLASKSDAYTKGHSGDDLLKMAKRFVSTLSEFRSQFNEKIIKNGIIWFLEELSFLGIELMDKGHFQKCLNTLVHGNIREPPEPYDTLRKTILKDMVKPTFSYDAIMNIISVTNSEYQHPTVTFFISGLLKNQPMDVDNNVTSGFLPFLQSCFPSDSAPLINAYWFYTNIDKCAENGHTNLLMLFIMFADALKVDYSHLLEYNWTSLVIKSCGQDLVFFRTLCQFVERLYKKRLYQLVFGKLNNSDDALTPLHEATSKGNYEVVEYLIGKYETDIISRSNQLIYCCVNDSHTKAMGIVEQKINIIRFLVSVAGKSILDEPLSHCLGHQVVEFTAVTTPGIHVKLFKYLIDLGASTTEEKFNATQFVGVLSFYTSKDVDELVDFLANKRLLKLLFKKSSDGLFGLEMCIHCNNLRPETLRKINESHKFSLEHFSDKRRILGLIVKSKWQPEMAKAFVEIFKNVDFTDDNNQTLLIHAGYFKSLSNIKYLVSAGADVNHLSDNGVSPLLATRSENKSDNNNPVDPIVIHECRQILLEAGADGNATDSKGNSIYEDTFLD